MGSRARAPRVRADGGINYCFRILRRGRDHGYLRVGAGSIIQSSVGRPGWTRLMRTLPGANALPTEVEIKKGPPFKEADVFAAKMLSGIGELLRPRQVAVGICPKALREGGKACPPHVPPFPPKTAGAPWAIRDLARGRAAGVEVARQRRNDVMTSVMSTGHLALSYLRYSVAGEFAGAWEHFGGLGAFVPNLAHLPELSVVQNTKSSAFRVRTELGVVASGPGTWGPTAGDR